MCVFSEIALAWWGSWAAGEGLAKTCVEAGQPFS